MTTTTYRSTPLDLPWADAEPRPTVSSWQRLLDHVGWNRWRLARTRAELLREADSIEATHPSFAADLRAAALAGTDTR